MSGFCFPLDIMGGLWESFLQDYGCNLLETSKEFFFTCQSF
jgi:hypothetical protein